jgi:hypothetical protein
VLISERDVTVDEIADRLDPRPARRRFLEQLPGDFRKPVGLAIAAAEQIDQGVRGQILDRMLNCGSKHRIGQAAVAHDAVAGKAHAAGGRDHAAAPIAEHVAIGRDFDDRVGGEEVRHDDIGCAGEVCAQHHDHRCRLREIVEHFESDAKLHSKAFPAAKGSKWLRNQRIQGAGRLIRPNTAGGGENDS